MKSENGAKRIKLGQVVTATGLCKTSGGGGGGQNVYGAI